MVRESKKQSRAKAKQMSNEKTVGEGVKGKSQRGRSIFLLRLSPLPSPIVFRLITYFTKHEHNHIQRFACHAG